MPYRTMSRVLILFTLSLFSATIACAQSPASSEIPAANADNAWRAAQLVGSSKRSLFVVTLDRPNRRQSCRVRSFTLDKLVCSRTIGAPRSYPPHQIAALILPGDDRLKLRLLLGLNAGLATAAWGTVMLVATCPVCAVVTGVTVLLLLGAAGAVLIADDQPDRLLYLAPGEHLTGKLRFIEPWHP
jgi:hypothetical protein